MNVLSTSLYYNFFYDSAADLYSLYCIVFYYMLVIYLLIGGGYTPWECTRAASFTLLVVFYTSMPCVLFSFYLTLEFILYRSFSFYCSFYLWLFEFYDDIIMPLFLFPILSFCKFDFYL